MEPLSTVFTCLIVLQFLAVTGHDWVDIPGWTHGSQVQAAVGRPKLALATLINAIFPGVAVALALYFWNKPKPGLVSGYWILYCAVTLGSAIAMWYVPYLGGASSEKKRDYLRMYAGTRQLLPPRGDNPCPNLLHVCFHLLFLVNLVLVLLLRWQSA